MKTLLRGLGGVAKVTFGIIGAIIVLIVIIAVAASAGSKSTGPTSSPALVTTPAHTTAAKAAPPARPQTFTGSGTENLGTINVPVASTLHWSCPGCSVFSITGQTSSYSQTIAVDSSSSTSGVTAVEPGTYHSVSVISDEGASGGSGWTITISPGT
jgi:hypothetical protein